MDNKIAGFFNLMVENSPEMFWAKDIEGRFIYSNKANDNFLGVEYPGESIGKKDLFFFEREKLRHPEKADWVTFGELCGDSDAKVVETRNAVRSKEYGNLRGEMVYLDVNKAPIFNEKGEITGTVGVGRDITKEKLFGIALEESQTRYRALLEANPDLMFLFNTDGVYIDWSGDRQNLISAPEFILNKSVTEVLPSELAKKTLESIASLIESDKMQVMKYTLSINGEDKHFESRMVRCGAEYFLTIIREITDQVKYETELKEAKSKAEESNRMKTVFLQNMSHELRTPLIGILGYSEILSEMPDLKTISVMAETINKSGHRLLETIDSLINIARIESNKQELRLTIIDVGKIIRQNLEVLTPMIKSHNVKIKVHISPKFYIEQDFQIINSIIMNLLSNAIKFTSDGEVRISAIRAVGEDGGLFVFTVEDTGIGIKDEDHELIFDAFRQGSEGYSRAYEGVGLGLTITKKYIEMLNGKIEIESKIGAGSKFTVMIPESIDSQFIRPGGESFPSILVVDDDPLMHDLAERIFDGKAIVYNAYDFNEADDLLTQNLYSLIIIDINLGSGENGLDVLKRIKENPELAGIPLAAVTAYAMAGDKEKLLESGFDYYLSKPFKKKDILDILEKSITKD